MLKYVLWFLEKDNNMKMKVIKNKEKIIVKKFSLVYILDRIICILNLMIIVFVSNEFL